MVSLKAIILAAGYATRLHPLTKNLSKCLIEVKGKPIIEYAIRKIEEVAQVDQIFIVTNEKFSLSFEQWLQSFSSSKQIKLINDRTASNEDRLGAIGDIAYVIDNEQLDSDLLIVGGDNLFEFSLVQFVNFFKEKKESVVALHYFKTKEEVTGKYGVASIDEQQKIVLFEEKPKQPKTTLAATACYIFTKEDLNELRNYIKENNIPDNPGEFIKFLAEKKSVYGFVFNERWFDIGSFESLGKAREEFQG